nr:MAG TPA: hypothetical protein [Caudoviricetes sp.]DAV67729.1 MAG TPA: hypothetical protein [Caudoviricetes sp.]
MLTYKTFRFQPYNQTVTPNLFYKTRRLIVFRLRFTAAKIQHFF